MKKIRVLIVDDSVIVQKILQAGLSKEPGIEVVGIASDPYAARDKILELKPDVLTLDIELPLMDGITFLEKLQKYYPIPVVVLSSLTPSSSAVALKAFELGAVEVMHKPIIDASYKLQEMITMLTDKIKAAVLAKYKIKGGLSGAQKVYNCGNAINSGVRNTDKIIAIGASTGGVEAIREIMTALPAVFPGILIAQHMPERFTKVFADDLSKRCKIEVREAKNGDILHEGLALVAPGNYHMVLTHSGEKFSVEVKDGPLVCRQRPSVEVLFDSVGKIAGNKAIGVILSGMGNDGAGGLLTMKTAGAFTIAQDEKTCVVFGMPKEAIACGAAMEIVPLQEIPQKLIEQCR